MSNLQTSVRTLAQKKGRRPVHATAAGMRTRSGDSGRGKKSAERIREKRRGKLYPSYKNCTERRESEHYSRKLSSLQDQDTLEFFCNLESIQALNI